MWDWSVVILEPNSVEVGPYLDILQRVRLAEKAEEPGVRRAEETEADLAEPAVAGVPAGRVPHGEDQLGGRVGRRQLAPPTHEREVHSSPVTLQSSTAIFGFALLHCFTSSRPASRAGCGEFCAKAETQAGLWSGRSTSGTAPW